MYRRALLVALVVCSMGILFAAAGPASAEVFSETPTPDGADDGSDTPDDGSADDGTEDDVDEDDADEDDSWYSGWGDDDENRSEYGSDDDREDDDGSDWGKDDERDDGHETDDGASNASADPDADGEGNTSRSSEEGPGEPDDEQGATDRQNETHREDGTDGGPGAADNETADGDESNQTRNLTERMLGLTNDTVQAVTDDVAGDLDGDGDPDVQLVDIDDGTVRVGGLAGDSSDGVADSDDGVEVVEVELDDEFVDDRGRLRAGNVTIGGVLVVPLGPPEPLAATSADEGPDGRPAPDVPTPSEAMAEAAAPDEPTSVTVAGSDTSEPDDSDGSDDGSGPATGAGDDGEGGAGDPPGSGAGAGAALVVTVGLLGGTRTAVDQTALLASQGPGNTLATLRHAVAGYLDDLPGGVLPALFGYSRNDSSDPLENETRAQIYDIVRESPGTYHAQLAEETGVAVETVRYHSRILAEEGLVEARKIRGRRRLFPVTMDDDEPELAAAIADSAASDVLSVIERREPMTLSAIAEAVDCAPSTVSYHVDRLEDDGLVTRERDGGAVRVQLRRSTRSALQGQVADD